MDIQWDRIDATDWQALTAAAAMPMQQHPGYGVAVSLLGGQVARAEIFSSGERIGLAQVIRRAFGPLRLSLLSRGPVWLQPVAPEAQRAAIRKLAVRAGAMIVTPLSGLCGFGLVPLVTPRHHAVIDLCPDLAQLRAGLSGKWRNRLVRAEAAGLDIRAGRPSPAELDWLLRTEDAQRKSRGYRALPAHFVRAWQKAGMGGQLYYEARAEGRKIAAMLVLVHAPWASYHIGWSGDDGRRLNAHTVLMWQVMCDLKIRGLRALDLGIVDTESSPGLARFKIGTGANVAALGATSLVLPKLTRRRW